MGEYFIAANLDKKEYFDLGQIGFNDKLADGAEGLWSELLAWLVTDAKHWEEEADHRISLPVNRGRWAGDRIIFAGDEGNAEAIYTDAVDGGLYLDITLDVLQPYIWYDMGRRMEWWEQGLIDDDGRIETAWEKRSRAQAARESQVPADRFYDL